MISRVLMPSSPTVVPAEATGIRRDPVARFDIWPQTTHIGVSSRSLRDSGIPPLRVASQPGQSLGLFSVQEPDRFLHEPGKCSGMPARAPRGLALVKGATPFSSGLRSPKRLSQVQVEMTRLVCIPQALQSYSPHGGASCLAWTPTILTTPRTWSCTHRNGAAERWALTRR
jgi:hypothetical protein